MNDISSRLSRLSPEKQALLARQLRATGPVSAAAEPLAVVGLGCRFPGGADSPQAFWRLLWQGVDTVAEVPDDRWLADDYFDPDPSRPGRMNTRWGTWIDRLDEFDSQFFGLAPRETAKMDPQQRLVLEVCWEALEDAGQTLEGLAGSRTGVFVGTHANDYSWMTFGGNAAPDAYDSTGTAHSIVANRVSYLLDLRGPSLALDTACSSSLVAVHLAVQALRQRECDLAVACGVNLMLSPLWSLALSKLGILSPDGRCRAFDSAANGIVRGEGCGAVVLKRLSEALADGDGIWAVVRGSATNSDGRTNGLTAPNGISQQAVVRAALANAGVEPGDVGAIEAHGTGTLLGDPIEVEALAEVLGRGDAGGNPCVLGSVKTNIGHLEGASGIAGLIKLVLSLHYEGLPRLVHFETPNPLLPLEGTRFVLSAAERPWPRAKRRRIGGVSSFGFGGTNAHVVVEEAPLPVGARGAEAADTGSTHVLVVSARTPDALRARAAAMGDWLTGAGRGESVTDVCFTAWVRRSRHEHGLAVVGTSHEELATRLAAGARGVSAPGLARTQHGTGRVPGLVFVFTGQGTQWPGMGHRLREGEPAAREALERCEAAIRTHAGWSLLEELDRSAESSRLSSTEIAQPAVFAIQVALAAWWRSMGVVPDAVVGHSMGEVAAAHVAGILSLEEAVRIIVHRARLMERTRGAGRMLAVEVALERAAAWADELGVSVAAVNSPSSCVLSGARDALEAAAGRLEREGVTHRWLPVEYAFHSAQMEPIRAELAAALGAVERQSARTLIASTVSAALVQGADLDAAYWARNVRETVRFRDAVDALGQSGHRTFVEIGPHPALLRPLQQCAAAWDDSAITVLPSLHRDLDDRAALRCAVGALHLAGHRCDARTLFSGSARMVRLPPYPWQREHYPLRRGDQATSERPTLATGPAADPLLGGRLATAIETYQIDVSPESPAWLGDHRVFGKVLYPAAALLATAWAAGAKAFGTESVAIEGLMIGRPLVVPADGFKRLQITSAGEGAGRRVRVFSSGMEEGGDVSWDEHASARVRPIDPPLDQASPSNVVGDPDGQGLDGADFYAQLATLGVGFGARFRGIRRLWPGEGRATALLPLSDGESAAGEALFRYPPLVDACLQVAAAALIQDQADRGLVLLPVAIERAWCRRPVGGELRVKAVARDRSRLAEEGVLFDLQGRDEGGALVFEIEGLHMRPSRATQFVSGESLLCAVEWVPAPVPAARPDSEGTAGARWLLLVDGQGIGHAVAAKLGESGQEALCIHSSGSTSGAATTAPADPDALRGWLDEILATGGPWRGVVCLWPLDAPRAPFADASRLEDACRATLGGALRVAQALVTRKARGAPRLWLVGRGACAVVPGDESNALGVAPLGGFVRVAGIEHPELRCARLDLDPTRHARDVEALAAELLADDDEIEVAYRHGERFVGRLRRVPLPPEAPFRQSKRLERSAARLLEELAWADVPRRAPGPAEVELRVLAAGLNFRDVLNAVGLYPGPEVPLGNECVGEIVAAGSGVSGLQAGDLVVAVAFGSMSDYVTTDASMVVPKPDTLSIAAAATIPIAFLTAHYALHELAKLGKGDRVLIHAGAGGVGLAAVQIALRAGATVLATAGNEDKREFLRRLGVAHAMDSRSLSFADEVAAVTGGRGVDVVLNSLSGDFIPRSLAATARGGRFLELGKRGILTAAEVASQRPDVAYHVVYLGEVCDTAPERVGAWLRALLDDVARGALEPLPFRVFERPQAVEAFRHMAQARHVGKVVLQIADSPVARVATPLVRAGTTHLVTGGLGGVGLAIADRLAAQGAAGLALVGRSRPSEAAESAIAGLRARGVSVQVFQGDVADRSRVAEILERIDAEMPALAGVWHAAGLLDDATLLEQDWGRFARVLAPKLLGGWCLHELTRRYRLDAFVLFSSAASLVGWPGQGNYASANAFLDALAHHRRQLGLPAMSINWGAWARVGMASSLGRADQQRMDRRGMRWMAPEHALEALQLAGRSGRAQVGVVSLDFAAFAASGVGAGLQRLLSDVAAPVMREAAGSTGAAAIRELGAEVAAAPSARRRAIVVTRVREQALRTLGLAPDFPLDPRQGLRDIGLDSLMAIELRNALQQIAGRPLPSTLLFDFPTVDSLSGYLLEAVSVDRKAAPPAAPAAAPDISEDEAEALLREELAMLAHGTTGE